MATEREIIRCPSCSLNQFATRNRLCRRCHKPYESLEPEPEPEPLPAPKELPPDARCRDVGFWLAIVLWKMRQDKNLSERALGRRMGVNRTYISKMEGGKITPTLSSLFRYAEALETDAYYIIRQTEFLVTGQ